MTASARSADVGLREMVWAPLFYFVVSVFLVSKSLGVEGARLVVRAVLLTCWWLPSLLLPSL